MKRLYNPVLGLLSLSGKYPLSELKQQMLSVSMKDYPLHLSKGMAVLYCVYKYHGGGGWLASL